MTDRELKKLSRIELLELLIVERKELNRLMDERGKMRRDMDALPTKLDTINNEMNEIQALLDQYCGDTDQKPYNSNGVYDMPTTMNGRYEISNE